MPTTRSSGKSRASSISGRERAWLPADRGSGRAPGSTGDADAIPTDAEIIAALRRKAEKGDAAAARELREWRTREDTATQGDGWLEVLSPQERRIVRRIIERALKRAGHLVTPDR
jgi:hypothetical protein